MSQAYVFETTAGWETLRMDVVDLDSDAAAKALGERLLKSRMGHDPHPELSVLVGRKADEAVEWLGAWRWDGGARWTA